MGECVWIENRAAEEQAQKTLKKRLIRCYEIELIHATILGVGQTPHRKAGNIVKEKMAEWCKANWANLSEKSAKSLINRVVAVIEKNPTSLKSALLSLAGSISGLSKKTDTSEQDLGELWFMSEFIVNMLVPIADHIDTITKENAKTKASTTSPRKRIEVWADSQEEAIALREALEDEKPAKPTRKTPRASDTSTNSNDDLIRDILAQLATLRISK